MIATIKDVNTATKMRSVIGISLNRFQNNLLKKKEALKSLTSKVSGGPWPSAQAQSQAQRQLNAQPAKHSTSMRRG
jgi:hypothetical protein